MPSLTAPPRTPDRPLGVLGAIVTVVVVFLVSQVIGAFALIGLVAIMVVAGHVKLDDLLNEDNIKKLLVQPLVLSAAAFASAGTLLLATFGTLRIAKLPFFRSVAIAKPRPSHIALAIVMLLATGPFADVVIQLVRTTFPGLTLNVLESIGDAAQAKGFAAVILFIAVSIGPGIAEETFFRGLIQRSLVPRLGAAGGIALTAFLFGAFHVDPPQAVGAAMLGVVLGFVAWRAKSIVPSMVAHAANNALALTAARTGALDNTAADNDPVTHAIVLVVAAVLMLGAGALLVRITREAQTAS